MSKGPKRGRLELVSAPAPSEWERLIGDFEADRAAHGLSVRTVDVYRDRLRRVLLPWCLAEGLEPQALQPRDLNRFSAELQSRGLSVQSVRSYVAAVNAFLRWLTKEGELGSTMTAPAPRKPDTLYVTLTREEIQQLEDAATTERDKLIVRVLADTGIRLGELLRLRVEDLVSDGRARYLKVRGSKGGDERLVPVTPGLYMRLDRFARRGRPSAASSALFLTLTRRPSGDYDALSEESVQHLLRYLQRKAGITKRVHPHAFRHSFATHLLRRGTNPIQVRDILGHRSLAMLDQVYSHLDRSDAHQAVMKALNLDDV